MTPRLVEELHRATDEVDQLPPVDPYDLLRRGEQRAVRRRLLATGGGLGAAAAVAAIAIAATTMTGAPSGSDGPVDPADRGPTHGSNQTPTQAVEAGVYTPQPVPTDEVLRMCPAQAGQQGLDPHLPWHLVSGVSGPFHAGDQVPLKYGNELLLCALPAPHDPGRRPQTVTGPIADEGDPDGILRQCGVVAGYDFTGWSVDSAMSQAQGTEALLLSANGYTVKCELQPSDWDAGGQSNVQFSEASERQITPTDDLPPDASYQVALNESSLGIKTASTPLDGVLLFGAMTLYDANGEIATNAATVTLTSTQGDTITRPVVRGHLAIRWHLPDEWEADVVYQVVVKDADGNVLADYSSRRFD